MCSDIPSPHTLPSVLVCGGRVWKGHGVPEQPGKRVHAELSVGTQAPVSCLCSCFCPCSCVLPGAWTVMALIPFTSHPPTSGRITRLSVTPGAQPKVQVACTGSPPTCRAGIREWGLFPLSCVDHEAEPRSHWPCLSSSSPMVYTGAGDRCMGLPWEVLALPCSPGHVRPEPPLPPR